MLAMISLNQLILRTDVSGMPLEWIHFQTAVKLYYSEQVAYTCGSSYSRHSWRCQCQNRACQPNRVEFHHCHAWQQATIARTLRTPFEQPFAVSA